MNTPVGDDRKWNERCNAPGGLLAAGSDVFRLFFERSTDAIWLFEPATGRFVDCNPAAVRLMGCESREQLLRARPEDLSPPFQPDGRASREAAAEVTARVQARGSLRFEWVVRRADGSLVPMEVLATAVSADGKPLHVVVSRDLTETKQAEAALQASQQLLASVADNISEAIYRSGPDHQLTFVNQAYLRLFGYDSLAELQGIPRVNLYADPAVREQLLDQLTQTGAFSHQEVEYVRKDGCHFWGLASARRIHDPHTGQVSFHVGAITDITARKRVEDEIRELNANLERRIAGRTAELTASEARLRTLLEHAPEVIVVFDGATGLFESCNENAVRFYGISREAMTKLRPADVSPEFQADGRSSAEAAREMMQRALAGETPVFEWTHRHASGRLIPCEVRLVRLPGDRPSLLRASITDNTERHRRELVQRATFQISEAVHTASDLESLYAQIHNIIMGLMPAQNFYIALYDASADLITFPYHVDELSETPEPRRPDTGLTGYVLRTGRPLLVDEAMNARKQCVGDAVTFEGLEEISYRESGTPAAIWLGVPLSLGGRPFGVMAVQDYHSAQAYGEEEKQILTFVAAQTALAIERKRAEQALRESEQKFRALFEASSQGVMLHDEEKFLEVNPATLRIMGYSGADQIVGRHPKDTSPPTQPNGESSAVLAQSFIQECMTRGSVRFDWVSLTAQGGHIPLEVILTRIPMGGRPIIQAVINDISERKKAEAELRESEARLRESEARFSAAFHGSPVFITVSRLSDGRFVEVNEAFLNWCGYARDEVVGRESAGLGLWLSLEDRREFWSELQQRRQVRNRECLLRNRLGAPHTMLLSADLIEINREPHALIVGLDITNRKQAEAELLKALEREKELGQLKSNFVSLVSHEFRTPLGIIMSSSEILEDYLEQLDPEERKQHLQSIQKNTRRMADLMEEVLLLARFDAGKMDFKPAPLDLRRFFQRVSDEVGSASNHQCPIQLRLGPLSAQAHADERLLEHVFTNLLGNAVKYSEPGSPVEFSVEQQRRDAVCVIRDHGIGIPEADMEWLFHAFHRGRNVGHRPGTGLGLVVVQRCVERHGGSIQAESRIGEGTTMTVRLPVFADKATPKSEI